MAGQTSVTIRVIANRLPAISAAARPAIAAEVKRAAMEIVAASQALAPVKTGTLRRSIHAQFPSDTSAVVGPSVDYAIYQEFGTRHHAAHPFMRPAADRVLPQLAGRVRAVLGKL